MFLLGAPGIGKTAIMEQIAQDLDVGFVSYSMTHHTRQSAPGPALHREEGLRRRGVRRVRVHHERDHRLRVRYHGGHRQAARASSSWTRSTASVGNADALPCCNFLQYKIFGRHRVPDGWIVVTAGNPPEYNRSVARVRHRHLGPAQAHRRGAGLRRLEASLPYETGVHPAGAHVPGHRKRDDFYKRGDHRGRQVGSSPPAAGTTCRP